MAAMFRITPGTSITATPRKPQYEPGETVIMDVSYTADAKGLAVVSGGIWTMYCEVYLFGKKFTSGGDQKSCGPFCDTDTETTNLSVNCGAAPAEGTYNGYAVAKCHSGL